MVGLLWPALSSGTFSNTDSPCEGPLPPHGTEKHITFHIFAPLLFGLSLMLKVCHNDIKGIAINLSPGRSGKSKNSHLPSTTHSPKCSVQKQTLSLCCFSRFSVGNAACCFFSKLMHIWVLIFTWLSYKKAVWGAKSVLYELFQYWYSLNEWMKGSTAVTSTSVLLLI